MTLVRWNPQRNLMNTWNEFDRMFDRLTKARKQESSELSNIGSWRPAIDITEREKEYLVSAELPGISEDDVNISLKDNVLTIKGEKKYERNEDKDNCYYQERVYGNFQRMVRLDSDIDSSKVEANYENGILNITLPKTKEIRDKKIKVNFKK